MAFYAFRTQLIPEYPHFTENDIPSQKGKVFIVTGGNTGVGYEIIKILYGKEAKVYMASRNEMKARAAITALEATPHTTPGELRFIHLDLDDLSTIKSAATDFMAQETTLNGLWHNAGVSLIPPEQRTPQGHGPVIATTCLGPYLLTKLLLSPLRLAAKNSPKGSVRVIFTSSRLMDVEAPNGGLIMSEVITPSPNKMRNYGTAKAGAFFLGSKFAEQLKSDGIVSLTVNPGNLLTSIYDKIPRVVVWTFRFLLYPAINGAYSNLWAGLSEEVTFEDSGRYVIPWGRWHPKLRQDILDGLKSAEEGGTGRAQEFWEWCEMETKAWR